MINKHYLTAWTEKTKRYRKRGKDKGSDSSVVVEFKAHAVVDFVGLESDVVLINGVPLLDPDLVGSVPV